MSSAIVWLRRDLRLADNPALCTAVDQYEHVIPVYVHSPARGDPWSPGEASRWWLHHTLNALALALERKGATLFLRVGEPLAELKMLIKATGASAVFWNRVYEPAMVSSDKIVETALRKEAIRVETFNATLLFEPWELQNSSGGPYQVFTPFWRRATKQLKLKLATSHAPPPAPRRIRTVFGLTTSSLEALGLLPKASWGEKFNRVWTPGEAAADDRLDKFCNQELGNYSVLRNEPASLGTSLLSPHLHFGEVSPRQVLWRVHAASEHHRGNNQRASVDRFLTELFWREFACHLLYHYPRSPRHPQRERFATFPWRKPTEYADDLRAWKRGHTGIPIVDAGMRELWSTGWMHNRVRMIVASFLTKNLLIPWQEGAHWFWNTLVDADLANNTLGWQWSAGCCASSQSYFRIFSPVLQAKKYDKDGVYLRRWIPALADRTGMDLYAPWTADIPLLCYPPPIVDLAASRHRALAAYTLFRKRQESVSKQPD